MNIFAISSDPVECARMLDDRRVVKMTTETAQMLSAALTRNSAQPFYKPTHSKHPCTLWVGESRENFEWTVELLAALNEEYKQRYEKDRDHLAFTKAFQTSKAQVREIRAGVLTPFANCSLFKEEPDTFLAYKKTMIQKWTNFKLPPRWTRSQQPAWASSLL